MKTQEQIDREDARAAERGFFGGAGSGQHIVKVSVRRDDQRNWVIILTFEDDTTRTMIFDADVDINPAHRISSEPRADDRRTHD